MNIRSRTFTCRGFNEIFKNTFRNCNKKQNNVRTNLMSFLSNHSDAFVSKLCLEVVFNRAKFFLDRRCLQGLYM